MALEVISTPIRSDTPLGSISDVAAGLSQLPYKFRREDIEVLSSSNVGGFHQLNLTANAPSEIETGNTIYVSGIATTIGLTTVVSVLTNTILTSTVWTENMGLGYANLLTSRSDYLVLVDPLEVATQESLLPRPESYKPQQNGELFIDLAGMISFVFQNKEAINYQLRVTEYYNNVTKDTIITDPVYALPAKKQILSIGGSNMWEYLLNDNLVAKQMTKFLNPVTWIGWKTTLYHVYDSYLLTRDGTNQKGWVLRSLDINKEIIQTLDFRETVTNLPKIYTLIIPESLKVFANTKYIWTAILRSTLYLSEQLYYKIKNPCKNAIMLEWVNSNGIPEQWLFEVSQDVTFQANDGFKYQRPIVNQLDEVSAPLKRIAFGEHQYMTLLAENLLQDQILALKEIKTSQEVWVWLDNDGDKKVGVIVESAFNTELTTKQNTGSFVVSIEFPKDFNFMP